MKLSKTSIVAGVIAVIVLSIAGWYFSRPQGSVEFAVAPHQITISYSGHSQLVTHSQVIKLSPGIYETTFSRQGFKEIKKKITVTKNQKTRVVMALTPITEEAKKLLADSVESQAVIKEYQDVQYTELTDSLPLSGANYVVTKCPSVKYPASNTSALCINAPTPEGEAAARQTIAQLGYSLEGRELLVGNATTKSIIRRDSYQIDYYTNVKTEGSGKPALFITPINTPYAPASTTLNPQLEAIKVAALTDLKTSGYDLSQYDIFYSDAYLSKYNPNTSSAEEHAMPPIF